jgi:acyl-CoA synthetase (NDP forming)
MTKMPAQTPNFFDGTHLGGQNAAFPDYEKMFHPKKIAILGVSLEGGSVGLGNGLLLALQAMGYEGEIFPVNPRGGTFAGLNILRNVEDIPGEIDFAIIAVAARMVPESLDACRKKGAAGAEIISSGFSELGTPEGISLERKIQDVAAKGIRVIGPNCFGIYCPKSGLTFMPSPDLSRESGTVAFLSQSGGMASDFASTGKWMGIRFSKVVSFGNGADLREIEFLQYLGDDPETHVISMYVEGIKNGESFFQTIKSVARKKPVIVYKGGLSEAGQRAVVSHTASMGGSRVIWPAILRQVHAIQVQDMQEMAQASLAFSLLPERVFQGVSVIGGGGALGVAACDVAESFGIGIPSFSSDLKASIETLLPKPGSSAANPVDVANPYVQPQILKEVLRNGASDERIDLQIMISLFYHYKAIARAMGKSVAAVTPYPELADVIAGVAKETNKPVIVVLPNPKRGLEDLDVVEMMERARQLFLEKGIPVFDEIKDAFRGIGHVNTYYAYKSAAHE